MILQQSVLVNAKGNSSSRADYNFTDSFPSAGTNYYRLKMVDSGWKIQIQPQWLQQVVILLISSLQRVYPNPFKKQLRVSFTAPDEQNLQIRTCQQNGRSHLSKRVYQS